MERDVLDLDPILCPAWLKCSEKLEVWNAESFRAFQNFEYRKFLFN